MELFNVWDTWEAQGQARRGYGQSNDAITILSWIHTVPFEYIPTSCNNVSLYSRGAVAIDFGATQESSGDAGNSPSTTTVASMAAGLRNEQ
ncbi:hypothetical protein AbraIFM66951_008576 [Aspergillus brasiliensis]|uniref:Uncharacterized protein n=1 Tax=Aspergillus brasiliensis TaxID=319629 RepID=A0A9W5YHG7_9EURO|nr:hypothetical protein AbraCBS73388_004144 [Aspergillus brasiliensis]GKZ41182.1 hypothetical protein AbraIFM66951_008576 [Aspergillus brasiliensis]